jgi:uncharacterized protein (TIGR02597 family)
LTKEFRVTIFCLFACAAFAGAQTESTTPRVQLPSVRLVVARPATPPTSKLVVDPSIFDLGQTETGRALRHTFTINNDGADFVIGTAECRGPCTVVSGSPYALKPGGRGSVTVEFTPKAEGAFNGYVNFHGEYSALSIVSGRAIAPSIANAGPQAGAASRLLLPEIVALGEGTSFHIRWHGEAGRPYQVWYSDDLLNWSAAGAPVVANEGITTYLDDGSNITPPPVAAPVRFYRVGESNTAIVGFRRVQLAAGDTPVSVPFLRTIAAQGTVSAVATKVLTDSTANYRAGQFEFDNAKQPLTHVLTVTSGAQNGRWFLIANNDAHTITIDDAEGACDLTKLLNVGDSYIVYPLHRISDVFGSPGDSTLRRGDQIFLWDVAAQTYEPPIGLDTPASDAHLDWIQDGKAAGNLPLFPAEGMLVKRAGKDTTELLLAGTVPFVPTVREIAAGNNLVGHGFPLPITVGQSDLLASGFAGSHLFSASDKIFLYNPKRNNFKTTVWYHTLVERWLSPIGDLRPSQVELAPASAFFIQHNQLRGFEWVQKPPDGK